MSRAGKEEPEETREELFAKKVNMWHRQTRDNWEWKDRPSYRHKTVNAAISQQRLEKQVKRDFDSLVDVEAGLNAMSDFLDGKEEYLEKSSAIIDNGINVDDMLQLKRSVKEKIKTSGRIIRSDLFKDPLVEIAREPPPRPVEEAIPKSILDDAMEPIASFRKPALLDMDGLKAARMHNKHRLMLLQQRKNGDSSTQPTITVDPRKITEPIEDFTFLTGVADTGGQEEGEDVAIKSPPSEPKPVPSRSASAGPLRSVTTPSADTALKPSSDQTIERSVISMHNLHELHSRPPIHPRHRRHTDLDEEPAQLAERQIEWWQRIEDKRRAARRERELAELQEVQMFPNVAKAQESWEKAKKAHAKEITREHQNDIMKKKLEDMKEEMRHLRIAEKAMRMKCYESEIQLLQHQRKLADAEEKGGLVDRKKIKKKKVRRRRRSADAVRDEGGETEAEAREVDSDPEEVLAKRSGGGSGANSSVRGSCTKSKRRPVSAGHIRRPLGANKKQEEIIDVLDLVLSPGGRSDQQDQHSRGVRKKKKKHREVSPDDVYSADLNQQRPTDRVQQKNNGDRNSISDRKRCDSKDIDNPKLTARAHEYDIKLSNDVVVDNRFDFDLDDDDDEEEENDLSDHRHENRPSGPRPATTNHKFTSEYVFDTDDRDGDSSRSSAQSSEIFAHRIKELTDREEAISKRQHDRRNGRLNGGSVSSGGSGGWSSGNSRYDGGAVPSSRYSRHNDDDDADTMASTSTASASAGTYVSNITDRTSAYVVGNGHGQDMHGSDRQYSYTLNSYSANPPPISDSVLDALHQQQEVVQGIASNTVRNQQRTKFFDSSSTSDKGRYRVHDARDFDTKSMFRKPDVLNSEVTLLMGKKRNSSQIEIITVLFDRSVFTEDSARRWWDSNKERLLMT